jgi:acyl-CoA thioester hydrolase
MQEASLDAAAAVTTLRLRVRFCDTDLMGIVHHANYLAYFEAGRVEWLRRRGVTYASWAERGMHLPVVEAGIRYRAPARFDDVLEVETRLIQLRSLSLRFGYRLACSGTPLAEGFTRLACVDESHRLQRFSPDILRILTSPESAPADPMLG